MATTRRSLLSKLAAIPALLHVSRGGAGAPASPTPTPAAASPSTPTPAEKKPSLLQQLARERYGKFVTEEQGGELDERIASLERTSARLRAVKFANWEEPVTDFSAERRR